MINQESINKVLEYLNFKHNKNVYAYKNDQFGHVIKVDFNGKGKIIYPDEIKINNKTTSILAKNEIFVV